MVSSAFLSLAMSLHPIGMSGRPAQSRGFSLLWGHLVPEEKNTYLVVHFVYKWEPTKI
jgi:hypothetical protein